MGAGSPPDCAISGVVETCHVIYTIVDTNLQGDLIYEFTTVRILLCILIYTPRMASIK